MLRSRTVSRATDATVADRTAIPSSTLSELAGAFGFGEVRERQYLADGLMNVNWRVDTSAGAFALKRVTDVPLDRLIRNLHVLGALAEDGIPVSAPAATTAGSVVAEVDGGIWCLFPWASGGHVRGIDLSLSQGSLAGCPPWSPAREAGPGLWSGSTFCCARYGHCGCHIA